jgi:hypothetical protein
MVPDCVPRLRLFANILTNRHNFRANGAEVASATDAHGLPDRMRDHAQPLYFGHFFGTTLRDHASRNMIPGSGVVSDFTEARRI